MLRILVGLSALALTSSTTPIEPGNWEAVSYNTRTELRDTGVQNVMYPIAQNLAAERNRCVTREDINGGPEGIFQGIGEIVSPGGRNLCRYSENSMAGGIIRGVAVCTTRAGYMNMTLNGTYTETTYAITAVMRWDSQGSPFIRSELTGRRTGNCR